MTKEEAIRWLLNNLEPEIKYGGCGTYKQYHTDKDFGCTVCDENLKTLANVKKVLEV